jgi:hypothetical protein
MKLLHDELVIKNKDAFINKVIAISARLDIDPNWLMHVMWNESRLNPAIVNSKTAATGLIQFMPTTARELGTSVALLAKMSNIQQLDYVEKYLSRYKSKIDSYVDLYFSVFFPVAMGKPLNWVLQTSKLTPALIASQNPSFDLNKDRQLTVAEVQTAMLKYVPASFVESFKKKEL